MGWVSGWPTLASALSVMNLFHCALVISVTAKIILEKSADSKATSTGDPSLSDSLVCWSSHLWRGWQVRRRHNQQISARAALVPNFFLSGLIFAEIAYTIDDRRCTFTVHRRMSVWKSRSLFSSPITPIGYVERHQTIIMIT